MSLTPGGSNQLQTLLLLEALEIPVENVNIVTYDSGAAARAAVAGGQTDFIITSGDGSEGIAEFVTPLGVFLEQPAKGWDARPINEALEPFGVTVPLIGDSMRGMAVVNGCRDKHPDRFAKLVSANQKVLEREDVQSFLERSRIGGEWLGPEKTRAQILLEHDSYKEYADIMTP